MPPRIVDHLGDPPVAEAPIQRGYRHDGLRPRVFISTGNDCAALRSARLAAIVDLIDHIRWNLQHTND
ncbi:MAG: hypothetical protein WCA78_12850 [Rhizomicrobium sp.]